MIRWALQTLWHGRGATLASAGGVALAMLLVLYLDAVFRGEADQVVAFIEHAPGDIWVLQDGIENLHMSRSRISDQAIADLRQALPDAQVLPVVYRDVLVGPPGDQRVAYAVGIGAQAGVEPWDIGHGAARPAPGEVVLPRPLAAMLGLALGDTVRIGEGQLRIAGLSRGTFSMANPLIYLEEGDARNLLKIGDGASFAVVTVATGEIDAAAQAIAAGVDDVEIVRRDDLIRSDWRLALEMGGELIRLMEIVGFLVSALVVCFAAFSFVARRQSELAVARALGASRKDIFGAVLVMSLSLALTGVLLAGLAILVSAPLLVRFVPQVAVNFSLPMYGHVGLGVTLIALLAVLAPARRVAQVDPTLVFQA